MKKLFIIMVLMAMAVSGINANGSNDSSKEQDGPKVVEFWYLWGGVEGEHVEEMIQEFNASQDEYVVEGLSVPDAQKIQVAIAAGDGPDISDTFSSLTASYAAKGILEPLDSYIKADNYDVSSFMPAALDSVTVDGTIYSLPISVNLMMLYYNKDLLSAAGYDGPPKTDVELMEYAKALTEVDSDGAITVQGFPDFPEVYFIEHMTYALGGNFGTKGNLTPDNVGSRNALEMIVEYRETYGLDESLTFNSSGGYMSAADPFISGRQALRIDGPWFGSHITNNLKMDLNYGVAPIPYAADIPGSERGGQVQTSTFFIPSNADEKDGAWAFMAWLHEKEQMAKLSSQMGWTPARVDALDSPLFNDVVNFEDFAEQAKSRNLTTFPAFESQSEYQKIIADAFQSAMMLEAGVDEALAEAQAKASELD